MVVNTLRMAQLNNYVAEFRGETFGSRRRLGRSDRGSTSVTIIIGQPILFDHVRCFFSNHNRRRVRVAADDRWHYRRINHSQTLHAVHSQSWIDHGGRVTGRSHLARAHRMVNGHAEMADRTFPILVGTKLVPRAPRYWYAVESRPVLSESSALADLVKKKKQLDTNEYYWRLGYGTREHCTYFAFDRLR